METFLKIFGGFLVIWIVWYLTGGPQRSTDIKPYVKYDAETNTIRASNEDLQGGLGGQVLDPARGVQNVNDSIQGQ